ncbi:MAG TPA: glycosyltransferase family 1 protein [Acetobacteraceae bacterium]
MSPSPPFPTACVDARGLLARHGTGVATYAAGLAEALASAGVPVQRLTEAGPAPTRLHRWLAALPPGSRPAPQTAPGLRTGADPFRTAQVFFDLHRRFMPLQDASPPGLMHWTYPVPLRFLGAPNIYTVHDVIPLQRPDLSPIPPARLRRLLQGIGRWAAHVVTVSEASRAALLAETGWPPARVTSTGQSVSVTGADPSAPTALGLQPGGYFLCAGTIEPRKNIARLLAAHAASNVSAPLVLAGPDGWRAAEQLQGAGPGLRRVPWLPRPALLGLMAGARAVLMPSLAEGFGLPVAEAMALGVPALASEDQALSEVAGGAALLADAESTGALTAAIQALDADSGLRASLAARGLRRAEAFMPAAHAVRLLAVYGAAAGWKATRTNSSTTS